MTFKNRATDQSSCEKYGLFTPNECTQIQEFIRAVTVESSLSYRFCLQCAVIIIMTDLSFFARKAAEVVTL